MPKSKSCKRLPNDKSEYTSVFKYYQNRLSHANFASYNATDSPMYKSRFSFGSQPVTGSSSP